MKKMNNKGFSLVELIIVIAIMAILAAAIAPALIRYIDKSRKSNDVTAAKTIMTAVNTALANEDANSEVAGMTAGAVLLKIDANGLNNVAGTAFSREVGSNLNSIPKVSYTKDGASTFVVELDDDREVFIYISGAKDGTHILQPTIDASYK